MSTEADHSDTQYSEGKVYLVTGGELNRLHRLIRQTRPKAGVGISISEGDAGMVISADGVGGGGLGPLIFLGMEAGVPQYFRVNAEKIDPPADGVADSSP